MTVCKEPEDVVCVFALQASAANYTVFDLKLLTWSWYVHNKTFVVFLQSARICNERNFPLEPVSLEADLSVTSISSLEADLSVTSINIFPSDRWLWVLKNVGLLDMCLFVQNCRMLVCWTCACLYKTAECWSAGHVLVCTKLQNVGLLDMCLFVQNCRKSHHQQSAVAPCSLLVSYSVCCYRQILQMCKCDRKCVCQLLIFLW
jgi:hypothetical protein